MAIVTKEVFSTCNFHAVDVEHNLFQALKSLHYELNEKNMAMVYDCNTWYRLLTTGVIRPDKEVDFFFYTASGSSSLVSSYTRKDKKVLFGS